MSAADVPVRKAYCGIIWKGGVPTPGHGEVLSTPKLAFFESNVEGSRWTKSCAVEGCGRYDTVHQEINPSTGRPGITDHAFVARPDPGFDSYYCGCRGWD